MRYQKQFGAVKAVDFSSCGSFIFVSSESNLLMYKKDTGLLLKSFKGHTATINSIKVSQTNTLIVSGSDDKIAIVWNYITGGIVSILTTGLGSIRHVEISADNEQILTSGEDGVYLWDTYKGTIIKTFDQYKTDKHL